MNSPVEIAAVLPEAQSPVLPVLRSVLRECGGWILDWQFGERAKTRFVFEFPRDICVEIYSALVALGLELTPSSHRILTELCRCTPHLFNMSSAIAAVDVASLAEATLYICSLEIVTVELNVQFVDRMATKCGGFHAA